MLVSSRPASRGIGSGPIEGRAASRAHVKRSRAQAGTSCAQRTSAPSPPRASISSRCAVGPGGTVLPWKRFQLLISTRLYATSVRVLLADPPAFTPWYDHELAAALAREGIEVELATSRFRFGDVPAPDGYRRHERYYPALLPALPAQPRPAAAEGGRARRGDGLARACPARRAAPAMARVAAGRRKAPLPRPERVHGARPAAAPHRLAPRSLGAAAAEVRPGRRAQRARPGERSRSSESTPASFPTPSTRAPRCAPMTAPPCSRSA